MYALIFKIYHFSSVTQSCPTISHPMGCSTPGFLVHHQLLELTQTHVHQVGDAIQPSHPHRPLLFPPPIFPRIMVFSNESVLCNRWPKYWSVSFSISPCNEYSGLISFRIDCFDLLQFRTLVCHLLPTQSVKVKVLVAQPHPTLCDPMDSSSPGSSVYGIFQARILEWVAIISFSRGSS